MNIGITAENSQKVANVLFLILSDEYILFTKTRYAHWNVVGQGFYGAHKFFEFQFTQLDQIIDDVAERMRSIGHFVPATLNNFLQSASISEKTEGDNSSITFIKDLIIDHESIIFKIRENIAKVADEYGDAGTSDFITSIMQQHEKMAWFLRSHISE